MTRRKDPPTEATEAAGPVALPEAVAEAPVAPPPAPKPPRRGLGIFGPLLGGAIAAGAGFGLAHFDAFSLRPPAAPDLSADIAGLKDQLTGLSDTAGGVAAIGQKLDTLETRLAALESRPAPEAPDLSGLQRLEDRLTAIEALPTGEGASTAAIAARLAQIETALQAMPAADTTALQAELDAAVARLGAAEAEASARATEAETAAAKANRDLALRALTETVTAGQPFVAELQALADPALDAALGPMAKTGVPTLAALQSTFPDAAREVLRLSREISADDGWTDRLVAFLAAQTEARSLTPQEGDDPDAILSRAEFALTEGNVADALAELGTLDPALAEPLADWIKAANLHHSALAALAAAGGE